MPERLSSVCLDICKTHVPLKRPKKRRTIPPDRRKLMRSRTKVTQPLAANPSNDKTAKLKKRLTEIEKSLRLSYEDEDQRQEEKATSNIKKNPNYFFSYAKRFSKAKTGIGPLRTAEKTLTICPTKMANLLSEQYNSAFSQPKYSDSTEDLLKLFPDEEQTRETLCSIHFSDADIEEAMCELRLNAAAGPDGIPACLFHKCSAALAPPLAAGAIWRKTLHEDKIPLILKSAFIVPIHKGKSKALPKNYRPVALTSQLTKVFEKVVRRQLVSFMDTHCLFNSGQHGFRAGRSCLSQLLDHFDTITKLLEQGKGVEVVYLDFAKAFDKVDIGVTLRKLHQMGIRGSLGRWLVSFLTGRLQSVVVNGKVSQPQPVISGVPQGSVLGPLLFLILLGCIDENFAHSFISSFADDTRVAKSINSANDPSLLQQDLNSIFKWARDSNMMFNSEKFEMLIRPRTY